MSSEKIPYAIPSSNAIGITCKACETGRLNHTKVQAYGDAIGYVGLFLALPSALVIVWIVGIGLFSSFFPASSESIDGVNERLGLALNSLPIILLALVPVLTGCFLMQTKDVLKCWNCGATIDAP